MAETDLQQPACRSPVLTATGNILCFVLMVNSGNSVANISSSSSGLATKDAVNGSRLLDFINRSQLTLIFTVVLLHLIAHWMISRITAQMLATAYDLTRSFYTTHFVFLCLISIIYHLYTSLRILKGIK